jgi:hypothetical protein
MLNFPRPQPSFVTALTYLAPKAEPEELDRAVVAVATGALPHALRKGRPLIAFKPLTSNAVRVLMTHRWPDMFGSAEYRDRIARKG